MYQTFREAGHHADRFSTRGSNPRRPERFQLDLWRATRDQLEGAGVMPGNIHVAELCTKTHRGTFHSYPWTGRAAGRMIGVMARAEGNRASS